MDNEGIFLRKMMIKFVGATLAANVTKLRKLPM